MEAASLLTPAFLWTQSVLASPPPLDRSPRRPTPPPSQAHCDEETEGASHSEEGMFGGTEILLAPSLWVDRSSCDDIDAISVVERRPKNDTNASTLPTALATTATSMVLPPLNSHLGPSPLVGSSVPSPPPRSPSASSARSGASVWRGLRRGWSNEGNRHCWLLHVSRSRVVV